MSNDEIASIVDDAHYVQRSRENSTLSFLDKFLEKISKSEHSRHNSGDDLSRLSAHDRVLRLSASLKCYACRCPTSWSFIHSHWDESTGATLRVRGS